MEEATRAYLHLLIIFIGFSASSSFNLFNSRKLLEDGRSLIFPPTTPTRTQFICGIGIPVEDLAYESVTSGYVLKAEYFLPTKSEELHYDYLKPMSMNGRKVRSLNETDPFFRKKSVDRSILLENVKERQNDLSKYRWLIYKAVETMTERSGHEGKVCMLKAICEYAESPFHFESGLLGEIFHIILTPTSSVDDILSHTNNEYFHAEYLGRSGAPCDQIFKECKVSVLDRFSHFVEVDNFIG